MSDTHLVDTNVHLRVSQPGSTDHIAALQAVRSLRSQGVELVVALQNLIESWAVATRPPAARGGLGLTPAQARAEIDQIVGLFRLLPDPPAVCGAWLGLLDAVGAAGVQAHDAHLVATMQANGITHILTFNIADFARYPGITAVDPGSVGEQAS